ncbi:MAG: beta-lactamase family protein [Arenimonas sp.]|nr:beta-lactamase family protein [Arenimonas sp.]
MSIRSMLEVLAQAASLPGCGQPTPAGRVTLAMNPRFLFAATLLLTVVAGAWARPLYDLGPVTRDAQRLVSTYGLDGASVRLAKGQGEVYREYFGSYGNSTRVGIASASKWLSALTLARLVERGELRWDSTVGEHFPEAPPASRGITLAQLFSHTSGMVSGEADCLSSRQFTLQTCALSILATPLAWAPGTTFAYGGNSMQVAGAMAERATGRSWDDLFLAEMVQPLGLAATDWTAGAIAPGYVRNANARIGGGARSTLDDYGRVLDMLLAGGLHQGQSFLTTQTLAVMALDRSAGLVIADTPLGGTGYGYGIGQWVEARDASGATFRVSSPGAFGFTPWVDWRSGSNGVILVYGSGARMRDDLTALELLSLDQLDFLRATQSVAPPRGPRPPRRLDAGPRAH